MIKKRFGNLQVTGIREFALSEKKEVKRALEMVAQEYQISDNPQDYVVGVVKAVQIDYPNDNGDNMPWEEVIKIKPDLGLMAYQTFILKPHFIEHVSDDPKKAKGCILDAHLVDSEGNTIGSKDEDKEMYVEVVLAVDKRKDPIYAYGFEKGILNKFSMGCSVEATRCSICSNIAYTDAEVCDHVKYSKMQLIDGKLVYEDCIGITYDELSNVSDPAYKRAVTKEILVARTARRKFNAYSEEWDEYEWNNPVSEWIETGLPAWKAFEWDWSGFSPKEAIAFMNNGIMTPQEAEMLLKINVA